MANPFDQFDTDPRAAREGLSYRREGDLRQFAALTPEESAADMADNARPENIALLDREIANARNPAVRNVLLEQRQRISEAPAFMQVMAADTAPPQRVARAVNPFDQFDAPAAPRAPVPTRTWGEAATDTLRSAAGGVGAVLESIGTVGGAVTGNMDNPMRNLGQSVRQYWKAGQSPALTAMEQDRAARVAAADGEWQKAGVAVEETLRNPALLGSFAAEQIPMLVPGAAAGRVAGVAAKAGGLAPAAAGGVATGAAVGTNAAMQGADVASGAYDEALKIPQEQWEASTAYREYRAQGITDADAKQRIALAISRQAGLGSGALSAALNALPGARAVERMLAGSAQKSGAGVVKSTLRSGAIEAGTEGAEEGGGQVAANLALQQVDPNRPTTQGVGEAAGMGALMGGVMGGAAGAMSSGAQPEIADAQRQREEQVAAVAAAGADLRKVLNDERPLDEIRAEEKAKEAAQRPPSEALDWFDALDTRKYIQGMQGPRRDEALQLMAIARDPRARFDLREDAAGRLYRLQLRASLPAPDSPSGGDTLIAGADGVRAETFEDRQAREQAESRRADMEALGLTPDVIEATLMREGLISRPEPATPPMLALPAPYFPTGRGGFVNDGELTRATTFEDEQARQYSIERQAELADMGLTPDVIRAQMVREGLRGDGSRSNPVTVREGADLDGIADAVNVDATPAQKLADNYRKGWVRFDGVLGQLGDVAIETPKGETRTAADGSWSVPNMPAHYGHLSNAKGNDGDGADVFIGDNPAATTVFVIDQIDPETGRYDETKSMVGFDSENAALTAYARSFSDGRGSDRIGAVTAMPIRQFVARAKADNLRNAVSYVQPPKDAIDLAEYGRELDAALDEAGNASPEDLMRGIGFTETEIKEAIRAVEPAAEERPQAPENQTGGNEPPRAQTGRAPDGTENNGTADRQPPETQPEPEPAAGSVGADELRFDGRGIGEIPDGELRQIAGKTRTPKVLKAISDELAKRRKEQAPPAAVPDNAEQARVADYRKGKVGARPEHEMSLADWSKEWAAEMSARTGEKVSPKAIGPEAHLDFIESALEEGKTVPDEAFKGHKAIDAGKWPLAAARLNPTAQPPAAAPAPSNVAQKPKHANMVIRQVRDRNGTMLGTVMEPYDGTIEGARKAAEAVTQRMYYEYPDAGNVASRMGATDELGNPKWAISPNFAYIDPVDSVSGRATFGDTEAIQQVFGLKVAKDVTPTAQEPPKAAAPAPVKRAANYKGRAWRDQNGDKKRVLDSTGNEQVVVMTEGKVGTTVMSVPELEALIAADTAPKAPAAAPAPKKRAAKPKAASAENQEATQPAKETDQQFSRRIMQEMADAKKAREAEEAVAAEEAKYQPFNAADIKKPTPSSLGLTPSTAAWARGVYEGRFVWTNRKIVDFAGGPKGVEKGLMPGGETMELPVGKIVPAEAATVRGVPVAVYHVDGKEVEYAVGLKFGDKVAAVDRDYFAYFTTTYPGAEFMVQPEYVEEGKGQGPIRVMRDGQMIGLVSPVRMDDAFRAKVRDMAPKTSEQPPATPVAEPVAPTQEKAAAEPKAESVSRETPEPEAAAKRRTPKRDADAIQDAGQKIGGARKDKWKERGLNLDDLDAMSESEGAELATKANVWKPDYAQMVADGATPKVVAMLKGVYDSLAAQPKDNTPEGRRRYVTMMQAFRQAYLEAIANPGDKTPEQVLRAAMETMKQRIGVVSADGRRTESVEAKKVLFSVYKGRSDPFVTDWMSTRKAEKLVREGFPEKGEPWKRRFFLRGQGGPGTTPRGVELVVEDAAKVGTPLTADQVKAGYYTVSGSTGGPKAYLPTKEDAEAAAKTLYEQALKANATEDKTPDRPHLDDLKREGLAQRTDRDVTADDFISEFGFRGVEFGNWAAQDERQRILNMAFDGMHDLAEIMGVPPRAMSLNGTMGMAFGARGGGRFAAHYEPGKLVINMTKLRGSGSLAHEFAHALDHYFGELDRQDAYKTKARGASGWYEQEAYTGEPMERLEKVDGQWKKVAKMRLPNLRPELAKAFDGVMSALFQDQETKAQMVRNLELQLERTQTMAMSEQDPKLKAMYERSVKSQRQNLEEVRQEPDDKTYPKGQSEYAKEAKRLSGKSESGYWSRPTEMFARAFESWVFDRLTAMGARSDYLVHGVESDRYAGKGYKGNPYPTGEERARINAAFDRLAKTFITREGDNGNVALASRSGYTAPYRDLDAARFTVKTSKTGMPVYLSRTMALSNAREKEALGVPKGGRALAFDIFDRRMKDANGMAKKVGMVLVHMDAAGKFVSLRNIQIDQAYREQGYYHGEGVIAGMLLHNGTTPMEVFNIQSAAKGDEDDALPFWKKIGTTILNNSSDPDVIIEGNISLARYISAGEKRANYGQSSRDSREQPIPRRNEARVGESDAGRAQGDASRSGRTGNVDAVRAELASAFGKDGVAALEREGILNITTWDNAPKGLTNQLQSGDHGAYWPSRKAAYIFADNLAPGQAAEVLLHEIGEHYGLKEMLGNQYARVMAQVKTLHKEGQPAIVAAWKHVQRNYDLEPGSPIFMQEVVAKAGQSADVRKMGWWQRLMDAIKAFLLKTGLRNVTSERDLGILLQASVRKAMRDANAPVTVNAGDAMAARLSDQLKGMNKDAGGDLFQGAPELDKPLTDAKARKAYDAIFAKLGQEGLGGLVFNWNESEINEDGDLKNYAGRDRMYTAKGQGGSYKVSKADFVRWLMSDAPFDPAKIQQDAEWRAEVNAARQASGLMDDAPLASRGDLGQTIDTLRSDATRRGAFNTLSDLMDSSETFNMWNRTIGTQYHKAKKDEHFRAVFDAVNQQIQDTSRFAMEAEQEAPNILQRMETMGDVGRALAQGSGKHREDMVAISKAVFANIEGQQGVKQKVFSDAELRKDFKLDDRQIGLYREFRAAVDASLDRMAQSLLMKMARRYVMTESVRGQSLDETFTAIDSMMGMRADQVRQQIADFEAGRTGKREVVRSLQMDAYGNLRQDYAVPETSDELAKDLADRLEEIGTVRQKMQEMRDYTRELQDSGYAPAMRFGRFTVAMGDEKAPEFFAMYETQAEANVAALALRQQNPGKEVRKSVLNDEQWKMFAGISPETVELFGKFMGLDEDAAFREYIALAVASKSAMKRMLERKGVAGFSWDAQRVLAQFVASNARQAAMNLNGPDITEALADIPQAKGDVQKEAQKLVQYVRNPQEEAAGLRNFLFMHFMGGSIASAAVNLTQPVLMTAPYLSQFVGAGDLAKIMTRAAKAAATGRVSNPGMQAALQRANADGITAPHEIHQLMADAGGSTGGDLAEKVTGGLITRQRWRAFSKAWGGFFALSEAFNRRLTFMAAYDVGLASKQPDPYLFAVEAVHETQGLYNKANRPNWARGAIGATLFTFKQFSVAYLEFLMRLPNKQKLMALGMLMVAAGLEGLPFADDLEDLIDTLGRRLGYATNSKKELRSAVADLLGDGAAEFALHGFSALPGFPLDVAGRLGMSNLVPGTRMLDPAKKDGFGEVAEVFGAAGGVVKSAVRAASAGNVSEVMPTALKNLAKAAEMMSTGEYRDSRGKRVTDATPLDAAVKAIGFQPATVAAGSRRITEGQRDIELAKSVESEIAGEMARAQVDGNQAAAVEAKDRLARWNAENPDMPIKITPQQIRRRVHEMRLTRDERFIKSAPPELRRRMLQEVTQ